MTQGNKDSAATKEAEPLRAAHYEPGVGYLIEIGTSICIFPREKGAAECPNDSLSVHLKTQAHLEMDVSGSPFAVLSPGIKTDLYESRD